MDPRDLEEDWEEWDPSKGSFVHHMIAGSAAGVAEHLAMFPFDTYKTHVQFSRGRASEPFLSFVRREGIPRMYRGASAVIMSCIPSHAAYFSVYEYTLTHTGARTAKGERAPGHQPVSAALSGALATMLHDAILTPFDAIKQRLQLGFYAGVIDCARVCIREEGIAALYRAYPVTLLMNVPFAAVVVATNESMKTMLNADGAPAAWKFLASGAVAGAVAAAATCPLDVLKTRVQTATLVSRSGAAPQTAQQGGAASSSNSVSGTGTFRSHGGSHVHARTGWRSVLASAFQPLLRPHAPRVALLYTASDARSSANPWRVARSILAEEGIAAFGKGMRARMLVHAPSTAVSWSTYEMVKRFLVDVSSSATPSMR